MKNQKKPSHTPQNSNHKNPASADCNIEKGLLYASDPNTEDLKKEFRKKNNFSPSAPSSLDSNCNIDLIMALIQKIDIDFLMDLSSKICLDDYKGLVGSLGLVTKSEGTTIIEKGKKPPYFFILLEGEVSYNTQSEISEESICIGKSQPGHLIYPQVFMTPKFVTFTIKCEDNCSFLVFSEEVYNRYMKKTLIKEADFAVNFLNKTTFFDGLGTLNIRKYLAFFIPKKFRYNQTIYQTGSQAHCIYLILEGEVQLFGSGIRLVKLGRGECFGLDSADKIQRKYEAKSIQSKLKVLQLDIRVLTFIRMENQIVDENFQLFMKKIDKLHHSLLNKNLKVLAGKDGKSNFVKRKRTRKVKPHHCKTEIKWWGLAENVKMQQKYKMPIPPKRNHFYRSLQKSESSSSPQTLLCHKIQGLRRRVLENDLEDYKEQCAELDDQQNQYERWITTSYVPKMKKKIKMLDPKPKAIDMVEEVKKKLITYAKNMATFCDRLNLE